ncbi:LacI family DNA-binding transcriptional regulator [Glycomyces tarimensis]
MGNDRFKSASIWDVAKLAGVSGMTVSRVVNRSPRVTDATRDSVLAAIEQLGYRPNRLARALVERAPLSVTVLTSDTSLYATGETIRGVEEVARQAGFSVSVAVLDPDRPNEEADLTALLPHAEAPTIVIAQDEATTEAARILRRVQPLSTVAVGSEDLVEGPEAADRVVGFDDRAVAAEATRFLVGLGHRTVHHLAVRSSTHRVLGWASALLEADRAVPPAVECGWMIPSAHEAARPLVTDQDVTAILCGTDELAIGVLRAAREAGRDVPGDLSVVGFDDCPFAAYLTPALTTVALDYRGIGRGAFEMLRLRLEGASVPDEPAWKAPELIVRETSGPPGRTAVRIGPASSTG